jgi:hypothetical protein
MFHSTNSDDLLLFWVRPEEKFLIGKISPGAISPGRLTPDSMFTFAMPEDMTKYLTFYSFCYALTYVLGLEAKRVRRKEYWMGTPAKSLGGTNAYIYKSNEAEYFSGLQYCFTTNDFPNAKPIIPLEVNSSARKIWLKTLKEYRKGLIVRIKLGTYDKLMQQHAADRTKLQSRFARPDIDSPLYVTALSDAMKMGQYPHALVLGFFQHCSLQLYPTFPDNMGIRWGFEDICKKLSYELRKSFGVLNAKV